MTWCGFYLHKSGLDYLDKLLDGLQLLHRWMLFKLCLQFGNVFITDRNNDQI